MKSNCTETGSALIITLIILVLLSIIGFAGLQNSDIELFSTRNTREFRQDFYIADGGLNRETIDCLDYPLYPTPEEQRNMNPFRIAMAANGTYPSCPDGGDCSTTNATLGDDHFVVTNFYDYAVDFRRRVQATMIKGESADINIIYYRIFSRTDNSTAVRAEGYFRTTTSM